MNTLCDADYAFQLYRLQFTVKTRIQLVTWLRISKEKLGILVILGIESLLKVKKTS